jgi:hypothetical protein
MSVMRKRERRLTAAYARGREAYLRGEAAPACQYTGREDEWEQLAFFAGFVGELRRQQARAKELTAQVMAKTGMSEEEAVKQLELHGGL